MWHKLEFEKKLETCLIDKYGQDKGGQYFTRYSSFRDNLIGDNAFNGIAAIEPGLTDHSEKHVAHVMDNVYKLLGEEPEKYLKPLEYYCLALMILFHDTGNLFKRDNHPNNVYKVYDHYKGNTEKRQERSIIIRGTAAHGGKAPDGSEDTLKDLPVEDSLDGEIIRLREIAALLRLGDELAEGLKRTSIFMQKSGLYPDSSTIYHEYAKITEILIDRNNGRISVAYNIEIDSSSYNSQEIEKLINFSIKRVLKLEVERGYNKNYSDILLPFKSTSVTFNIWIDGIISDLGFQRFDFRDKFPLPDQTDINIEDKISSHDLMCKINEKLKV